MSSVEKPEQNISREETTVVADEKGNEYVITGGDMFDMAYRLYVGLGGRELSQEECAQTLGRNGELRPRSGIFAISMQGGIKKQLIVENRNMRGDVEMNNILREVMEQNTSGEAPKSDV